MSTLTLTDQNRPGSSAAPPRDENGLRRDQPPVPASVGTSPATAAPAVGAGAGNRPGMEPPALPAANAAAAPSPALPPAAAKPKRAGAPLLPLLLLLGAGAALFYGVRAYLHAQHYEGTDDAFVEGHVIPVSPKVAANVVSVRFDDNYPVRKDQLLLELDPRDFEVSRSQAQANLAAARARLAQAQAQQDVARATVEQVRADVASAQATADNADADLRRNEALMRKLVINQRDLDNAVAAAKTADANLLSARKHLLQTQSQVELADAQRLGSEADVTQAEAQVRQAELQLSYARIFAPCDGRITRKNVEPGSYAQVGQALFSVVPADVWVTANFKETQLTRMRPGQPVEVKVDAFPQRRLRAHVDSVQSGTGSRFSLLPPENATGNYVKVVQRVPVKIVFDEPLPILLRLAPGMSVEPEVDVSAPEREVARPPLLGDYHPIMPPGGPAVPLPAPAGLADRR